MPEATAIRIRTHQQYTITRTTTRSSRSLIQLFILFSCFVSLINCAPLIYDDPDILASSQTEDEDESEVGTLRKEQQQNIDDTFDREQIKEDFQFIRGQLEKYGYLRGNPSLHEFRKSLKFFQSVLGVEETGEIDEATMEAASRPRCSQQDVRHPSKRSKRFTLSKQAKWDEKHFVGNTLTLKWNISSYTDDIDRATIRSVVHKAFKLWATQGNLKNEKKINLVFLESRDDADINILWATGAHGDNHNFDGAHGKLDANNRKENVLAHTFFPGYDFPLNGDIHFDDAETWDVDISAVDNGKRFFPYVLAHEIGHSLGLSHSRKTDALMYPYYKNIPLDEIRLDVDDKCGINWNYGGSSNFCLFVWLMSEIVEFHNGNNMSNNNHGVSPITTFRPSKKAIKSTRIPRCSSSNTRIKQLTEEKLARNLQFAPSEAKKYTDVVCHFLAGLHMYRAGSHYTPNEDIETEYHGVKQEVNTFTGSSRSSVRRMMRHAQRLQRRHLPSILDASYFDKSFFDKFFNEYSPS